MPPLKGEKMKTENKRLKELNLEKHGLLRKFEQHLISENERDENLKILENDIREEINKEIMRLNKKQIIKEEEFEMAKEEKEVKTEEVKSTETKKKGKSLQANSTASIAAKVLAMKSIKNMNDAIAKVDELKPGMDKAKIKSRINAVIYAVKQQKQTRWQNYTWDKEAFLLIEK